MRRTSHTTPRLAFTGAGCLLILIAGFGFWSLADAAGKIEQIRHLNAESDAYDAASDAVAVEDFLLTEALVAGRAGGPPTGVRRLRLTVR